MNLLRHKFLLLPFAILFSAILLDKIILIEFVQTYFTKTMSEINFQEKEQLFDDLKEYLQKPNRKKVLVYFGTSRALLFDLEYIHKKYPNWTLFNFSVPGGTPDYFLFWLEQFEKENVKPDFVLLDQSVELYNTSTTVGIDEVLTNSLSFSFLLRHFQYYSRDDWTSFLTKRMFLSYKYRPKLETILQRMKNNSEIAKGYRQIRNFLRAELKKGQGSASTPGNFTGSMPKETLKKSARGDFDSYCVPYSLDPNVLYFQESNMKTLQKMQIPFATIWVRLSREYFAYFENYKLDTNPPKTVVEIWKPTILSSQKKWNVPLWNMNEDSQYSCDQFSDAGHMAPVCYSEYTDYIFKRITNVTTY